jgi:hypothetical protein
MPAIPSIAIVLHRRHPSRLPYGFQQLAVAHCRSALTGPVADAEHLAEKREWQAVQWQSTFSTGRLVEARPSGRQQEGAW